MYLKTLDYIHESVNVGKYDEGMEILGEAAI